MAESLETDDNLLNEILIDLLAESVIIVPFESWVVKALVLFLNHEARVKNSRYRVPY